jgi:hypothetical protein
LAAADQQNGVIAEVEDIPISSEAELTAELRARRFTHGTVL